MTDRRALLVYLDAQRRHRCIEPGNPGRPADPHAPERARRAEAYARRADELLALVGRTRWPYDESEASEEFERIARRASLFDAVE